MDAKIYIKFVWYSMNGLVIVTYIAIPSSFYYFFSPLGWMKQVWDASCSVTASSLEMLPSWKRLSFLYLLNISVGICMLNLYYVIVHSFVICVPCSLQIMFNSILA